MERLVVEGLKCSYDGLNDVVSSVSFTVGRGELLFLLGPIGSGKTTIIRCLLGVLKPKAGSVRLNGVDLLSLPSRVRARLVGYVPQQLTPVDLTVFDAVLLGRYPWMRGLGPSRRDYDVVDRILGLMGLSGLAGRRLSELSGGQLQKVAIAHALAQEPKVLLMDEPTSNLDPRSKLEVMRVVRRVVKGEGKIAVIASHDLEVAARFADRIVMIRGGRVVAAGGLEVLNERNIFETYGLRVEILWVRGKPVIVPVEEG